jgi:hypothetical protein
MYFFADVVITFFLSLYRLFIVLLLSNWLTQCCGGGVDLAGYGALQVTLNQIGLHS